MLVSHQSSVHVRERPKIPFLRTDNSCHSQRAEGWARHLKSDSIDANSASAPLY